jgi:hypothetical protein
MSISDTPKKVDPEEECEYCDKSLLEGCNEYGSIFKDDGLEYPCPNNDNQFPPRPGVPD